mgnify:CR=1 FL=1
MPRIDAVLFDLGGTLAEYFTREQFPRVLAQALGEVSACLAERGLPLPTEADFRARVEAEDHTASDYRVRPLEGRLARIYGLTEASADAALLDAICRRWLRPVFALGRVYPDSIPLLQWLRRAGFRTAILSNSPWGSPAAPWREEVARLGLTPLVDEVLFCGDVGWRKPASPIFLEAMRRLDLPAERCVFVGDDPRWDLAGPQALGMPALLIDRTGQSGDLHSLAELEARLSR